MGALSWTFALFGLCVLLPWQCMLTTLKYMDLDLFPGCSWGLLITPLFNAVSVVTQVLMLFLGECAAAWRFAVFALPLGAAFAVGPMLCAVQDFVDPVSLRFKVGLATALGLAFCCNGLFQSSSSQLAARLNRPTAPLLAWWSNGLAVAGVLPVLVAGIAHPIAGPGGAVVAQFATCAVLLALSWVSLIVLVCRGVVTDDPLPRFAASPRPSMGNLPVLEDSCDDLTVEEEQAPPASVPSPPPARLVRPPSLGRIVARRLSSMSSDGLMRTQSMVFSVKDGLVKSRRLLLSLFLLYVQSYFVYPGISTQWDAPAKMTPETYGLVLVGAFQGLDCLGRLLSTHRGLQKALAVGHHNIWLILAVRMILPLFCVICWRRPTTDAIFGSVYLRVGALGLLGLSQGLLTNLIFTWSSITAAPGSRSVVGRALPLSLCLGIVASSTISSWIVASVPASTSS